LDEKSLYPRLLPHRWIPIRQSSRERELMDYGWMKYVISVRSSIAHKATEEDAPAVPGVMLLSCASHLSGTMEYLYTILKFIIGGGIIVGVTFLAHHVDPRYGGILAAAPITTTLAFIFTRYETSQIITRELVAASFVFAIPSVIFLISLYLLMIRIAFIPSLVAAYGVWLAAVLLVGKAVSIF
jgi:uncharacterized membrane protein (GlpM family)